MAPTGGSWPESTSSRPARASSTRVTSFSRRGHAPTEWCSSAPTAGQSGLTDRMPAGPTTHDGEVPPSARTLQTRSAVADVVRRTSTRPAPSCTVTTVSPPFRTVRDYPRTEPANTSGRSFPDGHARTGRGYQPRSRAQREEGDTRWRHRPSAGDGSGRGVVQLERRALRADARQLGEVVPRRWAGRRPLQRVAEAPRVVRGDH